MLLIFAPKITPRLRYIFDFIFNDILGTDFQITTDKDEFIRSNSPKLNYSSAPFGNEMFVPAANLLFERGRGGGGVGVGGGNETPVLFYTHPRYEFPFDLFAAS